MSEPKLDPQEFNRIVSLSEAASREQTQRSDEAFAAAMNREIRKGKLKVKPVTFVDNSPALGARRIYGDVRVSSCGSPAAMCMESNGAPNGAQSMR
jgi:hypothetical protein